MSWSSACSKLLRPAISRSPPEVVVEDIPLNSGVTVVVHERVDGLLIAESVTRRKIGELFA